MASKASKRIRKARVDPVTKLARGILPPEQIRPGQLAIRDVANRTDADQRASIRSGETRTIRKLTRVERLTRAGVITADQAAACEWYSANYELGFEVAQGVTANYCGAGGGGFGSSDLLSRHKAQQEARENFFYARQAIPQHLLDLFEAVVLNTGAPERNLNVRKHDRERFSLAAFLLHGQIGHLLAIAA